MRSRKSYLKNDFKNALEDNDSDNANRTTNEKMRSG